ncbi:MULTISPECIES: DNA polymerase I [Mesonia]|uniref:DNA polymerase I n=1 Tax=Mesonia oceanica TaxID=2687242 RepID=A0AC61Y8K6_9FLAO|nr:MULTISPECIES: DNA polymerase I [Mesonia]MAN27669.1 DNA polymerase I [Mesonia sp.]MAQ40274.1 DNA polymerase I [Mesonia sp.]MBJ97184.1 DNA polymerase I [Flavobacteriaceae bacterium]VVV00705.1 DNA polymerase I [Mesonia oceanica]|tara:strand:- start:16643 stop:19486 length:2844 start_codon:yes stop_codon:yes gene_type:complete
MAEQKRLFLLDAYALIFRGYYALIKNPRINSKGQDTSAIMGFMNSLFDVIKRENPDHLAVCFDKDGSAERKELYEDYKANRDETPTVIKDSVPIIQDILKAMHIPCIELSGLEADDIIGTLAKQAEKENYQVFMVTPDKDFGQLVSENIFMYRPARMGNGIEIWGIPEIQKRFGVERPEQVIDYLGMMGDASDNIPGLPGVGDKTAKKFIAQFGSMEGLLENTDQLKGKMKEKVIENSELGLLSKKLATIFTECDVQFDADDYELSQPNAEKVIEIFKELEFRRLTEQFVKMYNQEGEVSTKGLTTPQSPSEKKKSPTAGAGQFSLFGNDSDSENISAENIQGYLTIEKTSHFYQTVEEGFATDIFIGKLMEQKSVCFDTETTDLNTHQAKLVGIAFSWEKGKGYYLPIPKEDDKAQHTVNLLRPFFEAEEIEKIGQNLKYDIKVMANYDIEVKGPLFDTMLAHYIINPDMRHNMDVLSETYLNYQPVSIESLIGKKGKNQKTMREVPVKEQTEYAVEDADITLQLKRFFAEELKEANNEKLFNEIEIPLLRVLAAMEMEGIRLDKDFLKKLSDALEKDILQLEKTIYEEAGEEFNIGSPKQLGDILFGKLKLVDKPKKTRTGQYSTAEDVLSYLANDHQIVADVLEWRGLVKLKNTYVDALPEQIEEKTGRIHTDYMQTVAATGRLSSNNPNLQNIPIRTERGREVRKAFIPRDENYVLLAADYSQIELRIIAALSKEENMMKAFQDGEDIHASTAAKVFNVPMEEVTREQRSNAKTVNFGIIYGVSAFGLSNQTDLSRAESKELIDTYYKTYPKLRDYMDEQVEFAREHGYVSTVMGRRRYLKDINAKNHVVRSGAERNAVNAPIQGSAADIIKVAMINIQEKLKAGNYKSKMLLQVHDELVFDVHKDELEELKPMIQSEMENAFQLEVPLDVELGVGQNWLEAH